MTIPMLLSDAVSGSPSYSAGTWRLGKSGLYVSSGPLATRSGALSVDSFAASLAGTTVSVGPGRGVVQGATTTTQGAYEAYSTTTWTQALNAASSQDRIDLIYLRVWDNEVDASGLVQADFVYLAGTPSGSPVAPSIPAGQSGFRIATVSVPHTGSPALTQAGVMPYTVANGGAVPAFSTSQPASPENGQLRWRADRLPTVQPGPLEIWDSTNSAWDPIVPDGYGRGLAAAQVGTVNPGTPTSGATETRDDVLSTVQFTAVAGRRYRVVVTALAGNGSAVGDTFNVRVRDSGSASAPTSASTLVAEALYVSQATGAPGRVAIPLEDTFVAAGAGTHTLGFFAQRIAGTGVFTPVSPATLPRRIQVYDVSNF